MARRAAFCVALVVWAGTCGANVFTVTNADNAGAGSLRWAIGRANRHAGADTVQFAPEVDGSLISLLSPLPTITDANTTIRGDSSGDGIPDVRLDGARLTSPVADRALKITGDACTVSGLSICRFPAGGIYIVGASNCRISGCHLGASRSGLHPAPNGEYDIRLRRADDCTIGGTSQEQRNVIEGASAGSLHQRGISIEGGRRDTVLGNYIGLRRGGRQGLGTEGFHGVVVQADTSTDPPRGSRDNVIGGEVAGARNLIGGMPVGVRLAYGPVTNTHITGNTFGLTSDDRVVPIDQIAVELDSDTVSGTLIGGTSLAARNVFAGARIAGIYVAEAGTRNRIQGNYFGTNATGTAQRELQTGVIIEAGPQAEVTIGGGSAAAANFLAPWHAVGGVAVKVRSGGAIMVRNNVVGLLPNKADATAMLTGVWADGASPWIEDNLVYNAILNGVMVTGAAANPRVFGNRFARCRYAVYVTKQARCRLGNVGNANSRDDGWNRFASGNTWHIYNSTPNLIKAEGNDFGPVLRKEIDAKIYDHFDDPSLGLVDYQPVRSEIPSSGAAPNLALTGVGAVPTGSGAEVVFALSAPAEISVEVLNMAGRPIADPVSDRAVPAGRQSLLWSGLAATGTPVPAGRYLVRVTARAATGEQVQALTTMALR